MTIQQRIAQVHRDQDLSQKTREFATVAKYVMLGRGSLHTTIQSAKNAKAPDLILDILSKAAVAAGNTTDGTWGGPLSSFGLLATAFVSSLRNVGFFDAVVPFAKQVPLNVNLLVVTTGITASTVGQGQSKPISRITLAQNALNQQKAVAQVVASDEVVKMGGPVASALFTQELQKGVAVETDRQFLADALTGITPSASNGGTSGGIAADIAALLHALTLSAESRVLVAVDPTTAKHIAIQVSTFGDLAFPTMTINGGVIAGVQFVATDAIVNQMVAVDASQFAANAGTVEIDSTSEATVQMDTAPDSPPTASTNLVSLFQNNLTALKATRVWGAQRLRTGAVSAVNVNYGSANSPA